MRNRHVHRIIRLFQPNFAAAMVTPPPPLTALTIALSATSDMDLFGTTWLHDNARTTYEVDFSTDNLTWITFPPINTSALNLLSPATATHTNGSEVNLYLLPGNIIGCEVLDATYNPANPTTNGYTRIRYTIGAQTAPNSNIIQEQHTTAPTAPPTNPLLWLDANDPTTLWQDAAQTIPAADLQPVLKWRDKSGNNNHATQSTAANQPILIANAWNGHPVMQFDGINDRMTIATNLTQQVITIIAVANNNGGTGYRTLIAAGANSLYTSTATSNRWGTYLNVDVTYGSTLNSQSRILTAIIRAANDVSLRRDAIQVDATNGTGWPSRVATAIGGDPTGINHFLGRIGELLIYNRILTPTEIQQVEAYLAAKWGITI